MTVRQVHPWSLIEAHEKVGIAEAEAVQLARAASTSDTARLRAWIFVQLNQRSLQHALSTLLEDDALRVIFYHESSLLVRPDCRELLVDLLCAHAVPPASTHTRAPKVAAAA